jgi:hypothetical protein
MESNVLQLILSIVLALQSNIVLALDMSALVKRVERSVVRIDTESSSGSGVVIHDQGLISTSYHLIDGESSAVVILRSGTRLNTQSFLAVDPLRGLALIKTDALPTPCALPTAKELLPKIGDQVFAFGCPKGFPLASVQGTVSAIQTGAQLKDTMGPDSYRFLGCSPQTTWLQTTAPVSTGNTGGPLVNSDGEIIGINTWAHPNAANTNFAVALPDIARLLTLRDHTRAKANNGLASAAPPAPTRKRTYDLKLPLRTERVFSYELFNTSRGPAEGNDVTLTYPSGALYAAAKHQAGKLHGPTAAQYESGEPMAFVAFDEGKRHGILKTWSRDGDPILMSQYVNGRLDGFLCYHVDGKLAMIVQYKFDRPELIQMMSGNLPLESYVLREDAEKNPIARDLFERIDTYDKSLKRNEHRFKTRVRELDEDRRRALANSLAPGKRARIQSRANENAAANDAVIQGLYRRAYGR